MYIILSKSIRKEFILKVHRIKGFTVFTKFFNNFHICDNNIISNNNIFVVDDLTKPIPTEENLTVLYDGLKTYTIEYAISYFKYLIKNYDKLIGSNILDKSRYYHDCSMNFSKTKSCNCKINSPLAFKSFECVNADDIELSDKCAYCPIGNGCPICNCVKKEAICYMHIAEALACISIRYLLYKDICLDICIPSEYGKPFGSIYDSIYNKQQRHYIRYYDSTGEANILARVHCFGYKEEVKKLLSSFDINYSIDNNLGSINFITDSVVLNTVENKIRCICKDCHIDNLPADRFRSYITRSLIKENSNMSIFGIDCGEIIQDMAYFESVGNLFNAYTYSAIYALKHYISGNESVLDLGCGSGLLSLFSLYFGAREVIGMDIDDKSISEANRLLSKYSPSNKRYKILKYDIFDAIKDSTAQYDIIVGNLCYSMQVNIIKNISSILKPSGIYILSGIHILTERKLLSLIGNDLEVIDIKYMYKACTIILRKRG